jgi:UPF0716 family protein affecting phage T7 exclusion
MQVAISFMEIAMIIGANLTVSLFVMSATIGISEYILQSRSAHYTNDHNAPNVPKVLSMNE